MISVYTHCLSFRTFVAHRVNLLSCCLNLSVRYVFFFILTWITNGPVQENQWEWRKLQENSLSVEVGDCEIHSMKDGNKLIVWSVRGLCWIHYTFLAPLAFFIWFSHLFHLFISYLYCFYSLSLSQSLFHTQTHTHKHTMWQVRHDLSFRPAAGLNVVLCFWVPFKWVFLLCFSSLSTTGLFPHSNVVVCEY